MECFVAVGAIIGFILAAHFYIRINALEKKSRQIDALQQEVAALREIVGIESFSASASTPPPAEQPTRPIAPSTSPASQPTMRMPAGITPPTTPPAQPAHVPQPTLTLEPKLQATPTPAAAVPTPVVTKSAPSLVERIPDSPLWRWFMGSHIVVRVGILILFIGVAFLLKFAADQGWLSIELRLASASVLGIALVITGWRLRQKQRIYALTLQGGGLGIAYLTTFAAFRLYELLPAPLAFGLLVAIGMICGVLAVLNDAKALALPAIVGGFAAPLLVPTSGGSHVTLFSYFTLLNAAILLIAWYKSWRELNLVGFLFTFVLATFWGSEFYQPEFFATVEPFLILFFLFYLAIGLLFAWRQPPQLVGLVDGPLVFATPVITMLWQVRLVRDIPYGLAWSAVAMGLLYLLLFVLLGRASSNYRILRQSYLAISTVLLTLAVPLAVDDQLTSAIWALAGVGILWLGLRQNRLFHTLWGGVMQLGAAYFFAIEVVAGLFEEIAPPQIYWLGLLDALVVSGFLLAIAALLTGYLTLAAARRKEYLFVAGDLSFIAWGASLWGLAWWYGTGIYAISRYLLDDSGSLTVIALFFILTAVIGEWLGGRFDWRAIRLTSLLQWAAIILIAMLHLINGGLLFDGWGWLVWPAAVVVHYWMLYRLDHVAPLRIYHAIGLWFLTLLVILDLFVREFTWQDNWRWSYHLLIAPPVLLILLVSLFGKHLRWPTAKHYTHYMTFGLAPLIILVVSMSVINNFTHNGDSAPFAYLPLLNPLSIVHLITLATLAIWIMQLQKIVDDPSSLRPAWITGAILFFIWFNADVARIVHHYWDVPFEAEALLRSSLLQAIYSIIWTLLAMALMFTGTRLARRPLWIVGASLLALTVIKLLVLDLSAADTLARIISFIVVGLLMLLIGYLSPIPPAARSQEPASS